MYLQSLIHLNDMGYTLYKWSVIVSVVNHLCPRLRTSKGKSDSYTYNRSH